MKDSVVLRSKMNEISKLEKMKVIKLLLSKPLQQRKIAKIAAGQKLAGDIVSRDGEVLAASGTN